METHFEKRKTEEREKEKKRSRSWTFRIAASYMAAKVVFLCFFSLISKSKQVKYKQAYIKS